MLGIVGAMTVEVEKIIKSIDNKRTTVHSGFTFHTGTIGGVSLAVAECGIGKVNAALCASSMVHALNVSAVVNVGVAGAIDKDLRIYDAVISDTLIQHDYETSRVGDEIGFVSGVGVRDFEADAHLRKGLAEAARQLGSICREGLVVSGDQFSADYHEYYRIVEYFKDALCVDMESAAIAHACRIFGVPFCSVRVISDLPLSAEHQYLNSYENSAEIAQDIMLKYISSLPKEEGDARIASFQKDHRSLLPGIYVSRVDGDITTYDLRFRKPNTETIDNSAIHSIEHLFATFVRSSDIGSSVIYFGPMGCQTGFYFLVRGLSVEEVTGVIKKTISDILDYNGEMPGNSEQECGNYRNLSLAAAKAECEKFFEYIRGDK